MIERPARGTLEPARWFCGWQVGKDGLGLLHLAHGEQQRGVINAFGVGGWLARGGIFGEGCQQISLGTTEFQDALTGRAKKAINLY